MRTIINCDLSNFESDQESVASMRYIRTDEILDIFMIFKINAANAFIYNCLKS